MTLGVLETHGLTPAMVALDAMLKAGDVHALQIELNDNCGVCLEIGGAIPDVQAALASGRRVAETMGGRPVTTLIPNLAAAAEAGAFSRPEVNPLIQQHVVFPLTSTDMNATHSQPDVELPRALGFLETQGFTAVIEAIDTACKAAHVRVVGKEKLGGGFVTVVIEGELSAVEAAVAAGKERVGALGKLIAAHVIARPQASILALLPRI